MPVLDGYAATEKIRTMPEYNDVVIIALTADVDSRTKERAADIGFNMHLSKPIDIVKLTEALQQVLHNKPDNQD